MSAKGLRFRARIVNALVGNRTQDPSIKSAVLYQLSYERECGIYVIC